MKRFMRFCAAMVTLVLLTASPALASTESEPGVVISENGVPLGVRATFGTHHWVTLPCGGLGVLTSGQLMTDIDVVLDPGHGGEKDPGAVGANGLTEASLNLRVSKFAEELLEQRGISTVLTRSDDYATRLIVRAGVANSSGADLMVSVHHNAPRMAPSATPGVEVFIQKDSEDSKRLGGILWEEVMEGFDQFDVAWVAAPDAGVMTVLNTRGLDAYGMMRFPKIPAALAELGYLANPSEAELFQTDEYVRVAAKAIADAAERYLTTEDPGAGFETGRVFTPQPGISSSNCVNPPITGLLSLADWIRLPEEPRTTMDAGRHE